MSSENAPRDDSARSILESVEPAPSDSSHPFSFMESSSPFHEVGVGLGSMTDLHPLAGSDYLAPACREAFPASAASPASASASCHPSSFSSPSRSASRSPLLDRSSSRLDQIELVPLTSSSLDVLCEPSDSSPKAYSLDAQDETTTTTQQPLHPPSASDEKTTSSSSSPAPLCWITSLPWHASWAGALARTLTEGVTRAVTPAAALHLAVRLATTKPATAKKHILKTILLKQRKAALSALVDVWCAAEVAFAVWHAVRAHQLIKKPTDLALARPPPGEEFELAQQLAEQLRAAAAATNSTVAEELALWFVRDYKEHGGLLPAAASEMTRDDVEAWICYATTHKEPHEMERHERDALLKPLEALLPKDSLSPRRCRSGSDARYGRIRPIRLTMDPVRCSHRPLISYAVTHLGIKVAETAALWTRGFIHHGGGKVTYWRRAARPEREGAKQIPVCLLHGMGVGIVPYLGLVDLWLADEPGREVFLFEFHSISLRVAPTSPPSAEETVRIIADALASYGWEKAHFVGHSYGSSVLAWLVKMSSVVAAATFCDPICFLLGKADVAYGFSYRTPQTLLDCLVKYFVAEELHVAITLHRHFFGRHNCLPVSALEGVPFAVVLSEDDSIVPSKAVAAHLKAEAPETCVEVTILKGHSHAQFIVDAAARQTIHAAFRKADKKRHEEEERMEVASTKVRSLLGIAHAC